jgi:hypothetical protein
VTEDELLEFYRALALSSEEMAMKNGIASILWEKSASHIKVTEAGLDEIITAKTIGGRVDKPLAKTLSGARAPSTNGETCSFHVAPWFLVISADPGIRRWHDRTCDADPRRERERGRPPPRAVPGSRAPDPGRTPGQSDTLFEGLAKSVISLETPYRDGFVAGKLYGGLDSETVSEQKNELEEQVPYEIHEILAGRFSNAWSVKQVAVLLKKSSAKKTAPPLTPPTSPADLEVIPISQDIIEIGRDMADYTSEEMNEINIMGRIGMESDIIEASVRTLIFLLSLVKNPRRSAPEEKELNYFSGVVRQLEDMLSYILVKKIMISPRSLSALSYAHGLRIPTACDGSP